MFFLFVKRIGCWKCGNAYVGEKHDGSRQKQYIYGLYSGRTHKNSFVIKIFCCCALLCNIKVHIFIIFSRQWGFFIHIHCRIFSYRQFALFSPSSRTAIRPLELMIIDWNGIKYYRMPFLTWKHWTKYSSINKTTRNEYSYYEFRNEWLSLKVYSRIFNYWNCIEDISIIRCV